MISNRTVTILAAEAEPADARLLALSLASVGFEIRLARTSEELMALLRTELFGGAVIAVELELNGQALLARVARLPSMECVAAIGPGGDRRAEFGARSAGAVAYLSRPVTPAALLRVLGPLVPQWAMYPWPHAASAGKSMSRTVSPEGSGGGR